MGCGVWGVGCGYSVWRVVCSVGCEVWGVGCGVWGVGCGVWEGPDVGGVALAGGDDALVLDDQVVAVHHHLITNNGGLVCKAHRLSYHSTLGSRVIQKQRDTDKAT